ncbi:MAG: hypothetical protein KDG58_02415, partial [Anaerolineae bacterium]|nr:hypothetical protein [Anaerolineae bacterium]
MLRIRQKPNICSPPVWVRVIDTFSSVGRSHGDRSTWQSRAIAYFRHDRGVNGGKPYTWGLDAARGLSYNFLKTA